MGKSKKMWIKQKKLFFLKFGRLKESLPFTAGTNRYNLTKISKHGIMKKIGQDESLMANVVGIKDIRWRCTEI